MSDTPPSTTCLPQPSEPVRRAAGVIIRRVADESLLVPTVTRQVDLEHLFMLNPMGKYVWESLGETGATPNDLANGVAAHFETTHEQALSDIQTFLGELIEHGLATSMDKSA